MSLATQVSALATRVGTEVKSLWAAVNAKAPSASPTFTGTVTLPSTTSIGNVSSTELGYLDGVTSAIQTQLGNKAALASPTFTGTPAAPTAAAGTNTTQLATTAYVNAEITADRPYEATAANIKMNGTQAVGSLNTVARGDHVHPVDTSRAAASHSHTIPALTWGDVKNGKSIS